MTMGSSGELELEELWLSREVCDKWGGSVRLRCCAVPRAETVEGCFVCRTGERGRREPEEVLVRTARFDKVLDVFSRAMVAMDKRFCFKSCSPARLVLLRKWETVGDGKGVTGKRSTALESGNNDA